MIALLFLVAVAVSAIDPFLIVGYVAAALFAKGLARRDAQWRAGRDRDGGAVAGALGDERAGIEAI